MIISTFYVQIIEFGKKNALCIIVGSNKLTKLYSTTFSCALYSKLLH